MVLKPRLLDPLNMWMLQWITYSIIPEKHELWKLPDKVEKPMITTYWPEVDATTEIHPT